MNWLSLEKNGFPFQRSVVYCPLKLFDAHWQNLQQLVPGDKSDVVDPGLVANIQVKITEDSKLTLTIEVVKSSK